MENVPTYLSLAFGLTTGLAIWLFYRAAGHSLLFLGAVLAWLLVQGVLSWNGFYTVTTIVPPRFVLLVGPPMLAILGLFATAWGRAFLDALRPDRLTLLHLVRVPVELVLFGLYLHRAVPQLMTFEGRNWDVLSGLSAPVVFYLAFLKKWLGPRTLLVWNVVCLGLLINIVLNAILSAPTPFQRFAFEQPNVAILCFPFVWLPSCVVPLVLLSHLTVIRQLVARPAPVANAPLETS